MIYKKAITVLFFVVVALTAALGFSQPPVKSQPVPPKVHAAPPASATHKAPKPASNNPIVDLEADLITKRGAADSTIYLIGNVSFHHNGAIIQCDSALRYSESRMDFFGRVIINKDSAYIYGDKVCYDGQTGMAEVFSPLIKMLRGDVTLYSYNLKFDTKKNIATFVSGGLMNQKDNFMESLRGVYNADSNIVKFLDQVSMRSDKYIVKTDSLDYNLDAEMATFLTHTIVWDKDSNILEADKGFYFNQRDTYEFTKNAYVVTKDQEMMADTMSYNTLMRQATMQRNVQVLDTTQRTIAFSDWAYYDDSLGVAILTQMPSVRMYNEEHTDTTYIRSDSMFMLTFDPGKSPKRISPLDSLEDEEPEPPVAAPNDGAGTVDSRPKEMTDSAGMMPTGDSMAIADTTTTVPDSVARTSELPILQNDSLGTFTKADTIKIRKTKVKKEKAPKPPKPPRQKKIRGKKAVAKVDSLPNPSDTVTIADSLKRDSVSMRSDTLNHTTVDRLKLDSLSVADSVGVADSLQKDSLPKKQPEKERVIRAYHNVRAWAKDYQGVCDSLVAFSVDSVASLYGKPVLWSDNNQITADQMDVYSADEEIDWVDFIGSPFLIQKVNPPVPEPADSSRFNQASGKEMQAYFKNNELDSTVMSGNVMNYYFMEDKGYTAAFATVASANLTILFENREPIRMNWGQDPDWTIYPLDQIPIENTQRLEGFSWQDSIRPKNAQEISNRTLRPSRRTELTAVPKPTYPIERQILEYKATLLKAGGWSDRTELTTVTPEYFQEQNMLL